MGALLDREVPLENECSRCPDHQGRWRCQDCVFPEMLCRSCMRETHQHDPLHRIEQWNGKHFRAAALWEVGVYILIKHHGASNLCDSLKFQKTFLDDIQVKQDRLEVDAGRDSIPAEIDSSHMDWREDCPPTENNDAEMDSLVFAEMNRLYAAQENKGEQYFDTELQSDCEDDHEADELDESESWYTQYLSNSLLSGQSDKVTVNNDGTDTANNDGTANSGGTANQGTATANGDTARANIPNSDALNNPYMRIVHVNGIHHLPVVTCTCKGSDDLPIDLMYSRLIPTSFEKMRTLFTTTVLDTYRLANLELKASAYQYFQLLQRLSAKTSSQVPNLYNDLLKVSRAWRWMKKLKWAGFGHTSANPMTPAAGELSVFCPACPQPNINIPENWQNDPNRYF